jgi:hypothetical protein
MLIHCLRVMELQQYLSEISIGDRRYVIVRLRLTFICSFPPLSSNFHYLQQEVPVMFRLARNIDAPASAAASFVPFAQLTHDLYPITQSPQTQTPSTIPSRPTRHSRPGSRFDESEHSMLPIGKSSRRRASKKAKKSRSTADTSGMIAVHSEEQHRCHSLIEDDDDLTEVGITQNQPQGQESFLNEGSDNSILQDTSDDEQSLDSRPSQQVDEEMDENPSILDDQSDLEQNLHQMNVIDEDEAEEGERLRSLLAQHEARQAEKPSGEAIGTAGPANQMEVLVHDDHSRR